MSGKKNMKSVTISILILFLLSSSTIYAAPDVVNQDLPAERVDYSGVHGYEGLSEKPDIDSLSAILIESGRGQTLYAKNPDIKLHISAACKIMTSLVTIEKLKDSLDSKVTISKESVDAEGSALNLVVGEKYSVEDLLYAVMLRSANDAANALAEHVGGDVQEFVALMNDHAARLNLKNTHFSNPTGLYDETQYTTARDIAMLIKSASANPTFNKIFSTKSRPWIDPDGSTSIMVNQNSLFWAYDGVDGGKVGFNNKEQHSVITTATKNNQRLISVVLDAPKDSAFTDSQNILDYGFNNYMTGILVRKGEALENTSIGASNVNLISIGDIYYTFPIGQSYIKSYEVNLAKSLAPPIKKNFSVGTARYVLMDDTVIDVSLYPEKDINPPEDFISNVKSKLKENRDIYYLLIILVITEILIILFKFVRLIGKVFQKIRHTRTDYK